MAEKQYVEWKEIWKDEYLAWLCGFANAQGGKLYIGINNTGEIVGLTNYHKLLEDLPNKIRDAMGIIVNINLLAKGGKEYIEIDVPSYPIAISCKGSYYFRSGSTNQKLTGLELESFLMRKHGATWDNLPLPSFTMADVDDGVVKRFKKWALKKGRIDNSVLDEPKEILVEKLHLTNSGYLTNAAMLLFSDDPERWQLGAYTKIGFFETDADLRYQDEVHGSLLDQIDRIIEVLHLKYMKAMITYEGMQRIERYFVPDEALREALLNALCHKDYARGIPIQVSVYEDKLYIANCGKLPENWSFENLIGKHASEPYNPNIAHVYYLAGFIESWGRGVEKIFGACKADNLPVPVYDISGNTIMIKFTASSEMILRADSADDENDGNRDDDDGNRDEDDGNLNDKDDNHDGNREGDDGNQEVNDGNRDDNDGNLEVDEGNGEGNLNDSEGNHDGNREGNDGNLDDDREAVDGFGVIERAVLELIVNDGNLTSKQIAAVIGVSKSTVERAQRKLKNTGYIRREGSTRGKWIIQK